VASHELANPEEMDSHLAYALYPLVPVFFYARSRKAFPVCDPQRSLYDWWKVLLAVRRVMALI